MFCYMTYTRIHPLAIWKISLLFLVCSLYYFSLPVAFDSFKPCRVLMLLQRCKNHYHPYVVVVVGEHSYCLSHENTLAMVIKINACIDVYHICIITQVGHCCFCIPLDCHAILAVKWIFCCKHQNVFCRPITMTNVLQEINYIVYSLPKSTSWTVAVPYVPYLWLQQLHHYLISFTFLTTFQHLYHRHHPLLMHLLLIVNLLQVSRIFKKWKHCFVGINWHS